MIARSVVLILAALAVACVLWCAWYWNDIAALSDTHQILHLDGSCGWLCVDLVAYDHAIVQPQHIAWPGLVVDWGSELRSGGLSPPRYATTVRVFAVLPLLLLAGLAMTCWLLAGWWFSRSPARPRSPCVACGYDLRATPARCPECGRAAVLERPGGRG